MPIDFLASTAPQIDGLSRERTVFFFPVGPIEDHGPHLPLGTDLLEAEKLCELGGARLEKELSGWTAVLMPPAPLGIDSNTTYFSLTVRPHVLRDWLVDSVSSLRRLGFRHFACFSGHLGPKQLTAIEEAGKLVARGNIFGIRGKSSLVSLSSALVDAKEVRRSPFWPDAPEHGGVRDTSVAIYVSPELVQATATSLPAAELDSSFVTRWLQRVRHQTRGYWGDPRKSSAATGQATLEAVVDKVFERLRSHLNGVFAPSAFRSWYSIIPSNRSFFRSWMIAVGILVIFGIWASLNFSLID